MNELDVQKWNTIGTVDSAVGSVRTSPHLRGLIAVHVRDGDLIQLQILRLPPIKGDLNVYFLIGSIFTSALDSMLVKRSKKVFVAFCGQPTLSPGALYCFPTACRPMPPVYFVKGIASLYARTFSRYFFAFASLSPFIA